MTDTATDWFSEDTATFGDRLAAAREGAGLSQGDLAARIGVRKAVLEAWEEDTKEPRANRLQMLSGMLGVSLSWLLTGRGEGPEEPSEDATPVDPDIASMLIEMRALRTQMTQSTERLARLEKRLRRLNGGA